MKKAILFMSMAIVAIACKKEKIEAPHDDHDHDAVTTLKLELKDSANNVFTYYFRDLDGVGGVAPTIDTIQLVKGRTYAMTLSFLYESSSETEDLTAEIIAEADHHLICKSTTLSGLTFSSADEIGITGSLIVDQNTASEGTVRIRLKHFHDASEKPGGCDAGDTDVDVTFPTVVQ
ncbi:MAG: hypothetical protein J0G96_03815 [Flavobacteriia bacterium]|nr:hypothetical protein [Flavobacteriia bacterium]